MPEASALGQEWGFQSQRFAYSLYFAYSPLRAVHLSRQKLPSLLGAIHVPRHKWPEMSGLLPIPVGP